MMYRWAGICLAILFFIPTSFVYALVNINTADTSELQTLTGIGEVKAQAIVDYREDNGLFVSIEGIQNVSGIGDATYNNIKNDITVGEVGGTGTTPNNNDVPKEENEDDLEAESSSRTHTSVYADIQVPATRVVTGMSVRFEGFEDAHLQKTKPSYKWNFGDGMTGRGSVIHHTYTQPGSYVVSLEVKRYDKVETDQLVMTVVDAGLFISQAVSGPEGFIEIENQTQVTVDVSDWHLANSADVFMFPKKSYIAPNSTLRMTARVLGFESLASIDLIDGTGSIVASYPGNVEVIPESFYEEVAYTNSSSQEVIEGDVVDVREPVSTENLAAVGLATGPGEEEGFTVWTWVFSLLGIVVVASGLIFLLPKKRSPSVELLSAEDIDIIE